MSAQPIERKPTHRGTSNNRFRADVDARVTFDDDGAVMETTDRHDLPLPDGWREGRHLRRLSLCTR